MTNVEHASDAAYLAMSFLDVHGHIPEAVSQFELHEHRGNEEMPRKWRVTSCVIIAIVFFIVPVSSKEADMETDKKTEPPEGIWISEELCPVRKVRVTAEDGMVVW